MPNYNAIFEVLGQYARAFRQIDNLASRNLEFSSGGETFRSLDRLREQFVDVLNDDPRERDRLDAVNILTDAARAAGAWASGLAQSLNAWLLDALADELDAEGAGRDQILRELQRAMHADGESVAANAVSLGTLGADTNNTGDAAVYVSKTTVDPGENENDDERIRSQRIAIECVRDNAHHRVRVGQEEFIIRPEHGRAVNTRVIPVTRGAVPGTRNVIIDGAFDDESGGSFDHWTAESGASVFSRDTNTSLFGVGSLKVTGDGATAGDLRQDLADRDPPLESGRLWALGAWVRVGSHTAGEVTIDLLIDGVASALTLTVDGSTPTGQWLHLGGFQYLPRASFPNKVKARVACSGDFDGEVLMDGLSLAPAAEVPTRACGWRSSRAQARRRPRPSPTATPLTRQVTRPVSSRYSPATAWVSRCRRRERPLFRIPLRSSHDPHLEVRR